jgi:hypothetical protein
LAAWLIYLRLRTRRINAARALRDHSAHSPPNTGHDKGAIARSFGHGQGGRGGDF